MYNCEHHVLDCAALPPDGTGLRADPVEVFIVLSLLTAWAVVFAIFVHKWGTIRILQPRDYRRVQQR